VTRIRDGDDPLSIFNLLALNIYRLPCKRQRGATTRAYGSIERSSVFRFSSRRLSASIGKPDRSITGGSLIPASSVVVCRGTIDAVVE